MTNLSSQRQAGVSRVKRWRKHQSKRAHQVVYDAADHLRTGVAVDIDASYFAKFWVSVGLQIAASVLEEAANELLVEDIVKGEE